MTTKEKLLELFESNKGIYFSGEEIAGKLCVSRAAVWKAIAFPPKQTFCLRRALENI